MNQNQPGHGLIINPNESVFRLIRIHSDWIFCLDQSVSDWFWFIQIENLLRIHSDSFGLNILFRSIRVRLILIHSDWKFTSDSFGLNILFNQSVSDWFVFIRIEVSDLIGLSRVNFQPFFIKRVLKRFSDWFGLIRIRSDSFGFIWIHSDRSLGLSRVNFKAFFIKWDWKRFSDWHGLIRIGSDKVFGMIRNSSDWLGMNSYPKIWPRQLPTLTDWRYPPFINCRQTSIMKPVLHKIWLWNQDAWSNSWLNQS